MSTQPIALPSRGSPRNHISNSTNVDYTMSSGSYTGSNGNGSFNPASYTRHFLGSPISWRSTSFGLGMRFQGSPMDHTIGSPDQKPQLDSEVINAYGVLDREREFCRDYSCCGLHLTDLHALLEHFEEVHVVVIDQSSPQAQLQVPFNPQVVSQTSVPPYTPNQSQSAPVQQASYNVAFDPDEMDIEAPPPSATPSARSSPGAPTPPDTPLSTPLSAYPSPAINGHQPNFYLDKQQVQFQVTCSLNTSLTHRMFPSRRPPTVFPMACLLPLRHQDVSSSLFSDFHDSVVTCQREYACRTTQPNRPTLNLSFPSNNAHSSHPNTPHSPHVDPFNTYGRYAADYMVGMPGAKEGMDNFGMMGTVRAQRSSSSLAGAIEECVPPALLFSNTATPESTPSTSRVPSPQTQAPPPNVVTGKATPITITASGSSSALPNAPKEAAARLTASMQRPPTSLLLSKPFKCPKPNCNKSYKQANGLKYHMTHGSCNFAPPKDLEHVQQLLDKKRRDRAAAAGDSQPNTPLPSNPSTPTSPYPEITDAEMREVEREAERRLRPFACGVGDCQRRYKNMNGLRYHYQHSGEHGAVGLAMLASGVHECLGNGGSSGSNSREGSAVRGEREGRKARQSNKSSPPSRSTSLSRTGTPVSASGLNPANSHPHQQYTSPQSAQFPNLAYQQRYAEHQRVQFAQQHHYQPQHQQPQEIVVQHQTHQQQYAPVMYTPTSSVGLDISMAG
ncbi:hypothetical protein CPB85DRAFT_693256 [Mucidula mucida]|nr:hypothetical protein CPB85DRAFT_693256 [Mucidula mucida]